MAAVPLFRDTNMAAVTSRENTLYTEGNATTMQLEKNAQSGVKT